MALQQLLLQGHCSWQLLAGREEEAIDCRWLSYWVGPYALPHLAAVSAIPRS